MHPTVRQELVRLHHVEMERRLARASLLPESRPGGAAWVRARLRPIAFHVLRIPPAPTPRAGTC